MPHLRSGWDFLLLRAGVTAESRQNFESSVLFALGDMGMSSSCEGFFSSSRDANNPSSTSMSASADLGLVVLGSFVASLRGKVGKGVCSNFPSDATRVVRLRFAGHMWHMSAPSSQVPNCTALDER